ncbi:hypothetical protein LSH36_18g00030 [Paralvinella palmiformis]|uniref:TASOR pseudo-PARP domain-containing protein n=1 Tax=Paralvinella palmiformis TaxID=53620 RepID=A0AAD9KAU9_9ANNE|nr:hypothetical protein LSH36_18g00030 [Paralvinella palmiformis]
MAIVFLPENIVDVEEGGEAEKEILTLLKGSYLDQGFTSKWKPAKMQLIMTKSFKTEYDEKKQEMLIRGRKGCELDVRFGFVVENNIAALELVSSLGLQVHDSEYNALGYNRMGVYLCKHSDYIIGRHTTAIPRVASAAEFIEPTQGFDCHTSVIPPNPNDSLQNQFDRSQVYLYEINKLLQPASRPRQVMPYAVVHFTEEGLYTPLIDAEATSAEKLADNPRLQQIVNAINSKDKENGDEIPPVGIAPVQGAVSGLPAPIPVIGVGQVNSAPSLSPNALPGRPLVGAAKGSVMLSSPSPALVSNMDQPAVPNNQLRQAISQLTAKLEAEERTKKAAGSDIITSQVKTMPTVPRAAVPPGLAVRMPRMAASPGLGTPGLPSPVHGGSLQGAPALPQAANPALHLSTPVGAYLGNISNMPLQSSVINPAMLGMAGHNQAAMMAVGATLGHNGIIPGTTTLPPGFALPSPAGVPKAPPANHTMHGASILGSMPPQGMARSSPLVSMPAARSLTPDLQSPLHAGGMPAAGFLQPNGASTFSAQPVYNPGIIFSSSPVTYSALHQTQLAPGYSTAGISGTGLVPGYGGVEQQLALTKDAIKFEYPPGTALFGAKDPKMAGLYYQPIQPVTAAAYGQTVLLNQSLKRPLEGVGLTHTMDKRFKFI